MRCEPVRCTSTLIPGLATFSALVSARDVYQTTLPSFLAASPRASWATARAGAARRARPSRMGATERCRRQAIRIATPPGQPLREQGSVIIPPLHPEPPHPTQPSPRRSRRLGLAGRVSARSAALSLATGERDEKRACHSALVLSDPSPPLGERVG